MSNEKEAKNSQSFEINERADSEADIKTQVAGNLERIRNSRAVTALAIFAVAALLLDLQIQIKNNQIDASLKTQRYSASEIIYLSGIAGISLGVISFEDLLNLIRKK